METVSFSENERDSNVSAAADAVEEPRQQEHNQQVPLPAVPTSLPMDPSQDLETILMPPPPKRIRTGHGHEDEKSPFELHTKMNVSQNEVNNDDSATIIISSGGSEDEDSILKERHTNVDKSVSTNHYDHLETNDSTSRLQFNASLLDDDTHQITIQKHGDENTETETMDSSNNLSLTKEMEGVYHDETTQDCKEGDSNQIFNIPETNDTSSSSTLHVSTFDTQCSPSCHNDHCRLEEDAMNNHDNTPISTTASYDDHHNELQPKEFFPKKQYDDMIMDVRPTPISNHYHDESDMLQHQDIDHYHTEPESHSHFYNNSNSMQLLSTPSPSPTTLSCTIDTRFSDIIGHGTAKLRLDEMLLPLALPRSFADSILTGVRSAPGFCLLYGPPGTGKTLLAKAVAGEAQAAFISVGPSDVLSKFVGESEKSIKDLFEEARRKALRMESRCTILFFDEIDALGMSRGSSSDNLNGSSTGTSSSGGENNSRRVLAELLIQLTKLANSEHLEDDGSIEDDDKSTYSHVDDYRTYDERSGYSGNYDAEEESINGVQRDACFDNHVEHRNGYNDDDDSLYRVSPSSPLSKDESSDAKMNAFLNNYGAQSLSNPRCLKAESDDDRPLPRIIVIAATNRPEDCDPALLRRFSTQIAVGLPNRRDRKRLVLYHMKDIEHSLSKQNLNDIADATEGWSGSDLESLTRDAAMAPIRECLQRAAITKSKARKLKQKTHDHDNVVRTTSSTLKRDQYGAKTSVDENEHARDTLLNDLKTLRSISFQDFQKAAASWKGDDQQHGNGAYSMYQPTSHYDSDSDSSDDGES